MPIRKYNRLFSCLTFMLVVPLLAPAQSRQKENIKFERFTIEQGLSSDRVFSITQDKPGYIWIGTEAGISRYDGYGFTVYRSIPGDSTSLTNNQVNFVHCDRSGTLWIGTQNGLSRFDEVNGTFHSMNHVPGNHRSLPGRVVKAIHESASGQLWFGTDNGLARYDPETGGFISQWQHNGETVSLEGIVVTSISGDAGGSLWIGTTTKGVIRFNPASPAFEFLNEMKNPVISFPSANISKVKVTSSGEVWIGFLPRQGLGRFNPVTKSLRMYTQDPVKRPDFWNYISDILETSDSTLWVTTYYGGGGESGLHRYDEETDHFTKFTHEPYNSSSLSWAFAMTLFEDRFNNLWVGTSRGVNKADLKRWQMGFMHIDERDLRNLVNNFYAIEEVQDDVFWIGLDGDGFIEWDRKKGIKKHFDTTDQRSLEGVYSIKKDFDGSVWLGYSGKGIARYDPVTAKTAKFMNEPGNPASLSGNYVTDLLVDRRKNLWIATSGGLSRYDRTRKNFTNWTTSTTGDNGMTGNSLSTLFEDSRGYLWIGSKEHVYDPSSTIATGLMRYEPETNTFLSYRHDPSNFNSLSSDAVRCINEDADGNIWIGTNNGLNRLDPKTGQFKIFLESDGLPDPNVMGILIDDRGVLWMSTLNGISRFDPSTGIFRNYTLEDGVQAFRFNENSYYKTSKGELIFGGIAGANYFFPSEISGQQVVPEVFITRFLKQNQSFRFDKPLHEIKEIDLRWNENSIDFEFVAINFRSPTETVYEYKLEGFEKDWIDAGKRRYVNYTHLPAGEYTFRVRAMNSEGIWTKNDAAVNIKIEPPYWLTWYAYTFYGLLLLLIIINVDRYQRRRLISRERERTKDRELEQAREIEKAYTELKSTQSQLIQSEKMASLGELTAGIAHEIQNPLNFVNNFSDLSKELLEEMSAEMEKGNTGEARDIAQDVLLNLDKIIHHGKRADAIVKGMLLHSRTHSGSREPTNVNALADEYLRLSYHGLRAKDKSFNSGMKTDFDENIGLVDIIPQDIGRVILNLLTNAFYAVNEKKKDQPEGYDPIVSISTRNLGDVAEIKVRDNGNGIRQEVLDKIFHPFFTTKPAGQGTGLGLSLSYDIITKGHGGALTVNTLEGAHTEFVIHLPLKNQT